MSVSPAAPMVVVSSMGKMEVASPAAAVVAHSSASRSVGVTTWRGVRESVVVDDVVVELIDDGVVLRSSWAETKLASLESQKRVTLRVSSGLTGELDGVVRGARELDCDWARLSSSSRSRKSGSLAFLVIAEAFLGVVTELLLAAVEGRRCVEPKTIFSQCSPYWELRKLDMVRASRRRCSTSIVLASLLCKRSEEVSVELPPGWASRCSLALQALKDLRW